MSAKKSNPATAFLDERPVPATESVSTASEAATAVLEAPGASRAPERTLDENTLSAIGEEFESDERAICAAVGILARQPDARQRSPAEQRIVERAFPDERDRVAEQRRANARIQLRPMAGTNSEFAAAKAAADAAAKRAQAELPAIEEKLAKLHAERQTLESTATTTARQVDAMADARHKLRDAAPRYINESAAVARRAVKQEFFDVVKDEGRRVSVVGIQAALPTAADALEHFAGSHGSMAEHVRGSYPQLTEWQTDGWRLGPGGWKAYLDALGVELQAIDARLAVRRPARDAALAEIVADIDRWIEEELAG